MLPLWRRNCVLLDLDGTVIDSQEGIFHALAYMYDASGMEKPPVAEMRRFIGPAIGTMLRELYSFSPERIDEMVRLYREYYGEKGLLECRLYPGIGHLVRRLRGQGKQVAIATKKPEPFSKRILANLGPLPDLNGVFGADPADKSDHKDGIIRTALQTLGVSDPQGAVLVGDTRFDCIGARLAGIDCLGVAYGFGSGEELRENGAIGVAETVAELEMLLCGTEA